MEITKENFHNYIIQYEEDEKFYKEMYLQETFHPDTFLDYIAALDRDYILSHQLMVPALLDTPWYPYIPEDALFSDLPGNILPAKHYRYTPVFQHQHEFFEVISVYDGHADTTIQGVTHQLQKGDICIIPPNTIHSIGIFDDSIAINLAIRSSSFQSTFFPLITQDNPLSRFFSHVLYKKTEGNYLIFETGNDPVILSLLEDIYIEFLGHKKYSQAFLNTLIMIFWAQLLRRHEQNINSFLTREHQSVSMVHILDYINTNYQSISLQDTARHFGFSVPHFGTLIKESTGCTFLQIIKGIKMNQACRALKETSLSISAICELVGYENPEHFMRTFKKEYGMTPGEYRKL